MNEMDRLRLKRAAEDMRAIARELRSVAPLASMQASKLALELELRLERECR